MGCGSSKKMMKNIIPTSLQNPYLPPGEYCEHCTLSHPEKKCSINIAKIHQKHRKENSDERIREGYSGKKLKSLLQKKSTYFEEDGVNPSRPHLVSWEPPSMIDYEDHLNGCHVPEGMDQNLKINSNVDENPLRAIEVSFHSSEEENGNCESICKEREDPLEKTLPEFNSKDLKVDEKQFVSSDEELDEILQLKEYMSPIYIIPGKYNPENFDDIVKNKGVKEILNFDKIREKVEGRSKEEEEDEDMKHRSKKAKAVNDKLLEYERNEERA